MKMNVEGRRGRRKPKKRWLDVTGCNMRTAVVCENDVGDRIKRRFRTRAADPKELG